MTEETLQKVVNLERRLHNLKHSKSTAETARDFSELLQALQLGRLRDLENLMFEEIKNKTLFLISIELDKAFKELEAL